MSVDNDLSNLSAEQLESILDGESSIETGDTSANPDPDPGPAEDTTETEAMPKSERDGEPSEADLLRAQVEEADARARHWEKTAGRHGGKIGHLSELLRKHGIETAAGGHDPDPSSASADADSYDGGLDADLRSEPEPYRESRPTPEPQPTRHDDVTAWAIDRAVEETGRAFAQQHPALRDPALAHAVVERMQKDGFSLDRIAEAASPYRAAQDFNDALEAAYYSIERPRLEARRAEQFANQHRAKIMASPSGSGAATPPRAAPKTLDDMSVSELDAELRRLTAGSGYR